MQVVKQSPWHRYRPWIITVLVVALFAWAFSGIPMSSVKPQALLITKAIFTGLFLRLYRGWRRFDHSVG